MFEGKRILLGVTGGIAAYKAADLASKLMQADADVDVIMTEAAQKFVTPLTFESLVHKNVYTGMWDAHVKEPTHISLSERADLIIVAPATANIIAKMATGLADDLLSCILLATRAPILVAPAMNDNMYSHPATQANIKTLSERGGVSFVGPVEGRLASGKVGARGRMCPTAEILHAAESILA
jgi:phosphopantothenoylcysteine decarboxylase/phosphopantothenate--cysteine ligase